jgi:hypothetical protein
MLQRCATVFIAMEAWRTLIPFAAVANKSMETAGTG